MKRTPLALAALVATALPVTASAQEATGYATNHYNPSERGSLWFANESLDLRGHGRIALGAVGDASYRSVVHYRDGEVFQSVVRNQGFIHLGGSFIFADRVRFALSLPVQVFADGRQTTLAGVTYRPPSDEVSVGDTRLAADVRLFGEYGGTLTGALGAQLFLPSGSPTAYTGDGEPRVAPRFAVAGRAGSLAYAGKLGVTIRGRDEPFANGRVGSDVFFSASAGVLLANDKILIGPELWGSTVVSKGSAFESATTPIEALLGAHWDVAEGLRVGAAGGAGVARGIGVPVARGLLSVEWVPGMPKPAAEPAAEDRDGDGVPDKDDACPYAAGPKSDDPAKNGCPVPDLDKDGIPDAVDACPCVPGVTTQDPKTNGCPPDRDHDGIADPDDACPDQPGKPSSDPKRNGCPDQDRDGDGVLDAEDACPDQAGPRTSDPKTNGCPDPDRDHDGIPNEADACPDEPGAKDPDPKKNGCPKAFLSGGQIKIIDQVRFKTASAAIQPGKESQEVLEAVLAVLTAHPEIGKVRVEGHTDNVGDAKMNKKLSEARAQSVVAWLVGKGIAKERLHAEGFGEEKPIEDNGTDAGRRTNRRVEFHVEESKQ